MNALEIAVAERLEAAVGVLLAAQRRAAVESKCPHCSRRHTMAVEQAEREVLIAAERWYADGGD